MKKVSQRNAPGAISAMAFEVRPVRPSVVGGFVGVSAAMRAPVLVRCTCSSYGSWFEREAEIDGAADDAALGSCATSAPAGRRPASPRSTFSRLKSGELAGGDTSTNDSNVY